MRLLLAEVRKLVAELLDAAAERVDALLRAGVERVRFAGGLDLEQRQLAAVFHLDRLAGLGARTGHELEAVRQVDEADVAVVRVNAFFHGKPLGVVAGATPNLSAHFPRSGKPRIIAWAAISPHAASCRRSRGCSSSASSCRG